MRNLILAILATLFTASVVAATVLVEAEAFNVHGGWTLDAQHMGVMGSPYLLAHGLGDPVENAATEFFASESGDYDVYVRTRNWTAPWSKMAAGRFKLIVNAVELPTVFGEGDGQWRWVKASARVRLEKGRNKIELKDLTGFDARVDAICFTTDGEFVEPVRKYGAIDDAGHFDLVVCGGGMAGICAALSAARSGIKVALLQDRPVLGGNNSSEIRVHLGGHIQCGKYPHLGDIVAEVGPKHGGNARSGKIYEDDRKLAAVMAEKNISLYLNTRADAVEKSGDSIAAVIGIDVCSGKRSRFSAPLFLDATGDGTIGAAAGAHWRMGRESKAQTGEKSAPEQADSLTMGSSCQWRAVNVAEPNKFPAHAWMIEFDEKTATAALKGDWDWETGLGRDQIAEAEYIRDYGMLVAYSNWSFVKNFSKRKDEFKFKRLEWLSSVAGKRESRRLLGDVILDEKDLIESVEYPDGTCLASWSIDLHYPRTSQQTGFKGESFRSTCEQFKIVMYPIPYRCFYSRNVLNLFMAGRNISATHIALGSIRVMRTTGMMGEVVGMAAAICRQFDCLPRDVYTLHFKELEKRMAKGVGVKLAQTSQLYNLHPTYGFDAKDKIGRRRHALMGWAETSDYMARPPAVKWSYPPQAWPRWEAYREQSLARTYAITAPNTIEFPPPFKNAVFRDRNGKTVEVSAAAALGVPCLQGDGYETLTEDGRWVSCDVFEGSRDDAPHRLGFIPRELTPAYRDGLYDMGGVMVGKVFCLAKKKPLMRTGETREELFAPESVAKAPCKLEKTQVSDIWSTTMPLAFRFLDFDGDIEDVWVVTDGERNLLKHNFAESKALRNKIWNACVRTLSLCTRRFYVSSVNAQRTPSPEDLAVAMIADSAAYANSAAARFSLDALLSAENLSEKELAWLIVDFSLYLRLYGDGVFIRNRWNGLRRRIAAVSGDGVESFAALAAAAELAHELGESDTAAFAEQKALALKAAISSRIGSGKNFRNREEMVLSTVFDLVDAKDVLGGDVSIDGERDNFASPRLLGFEALALAAAGRKDAAYSLIENVWGAMVNCKDGTSCRVGGVLPVYLLPQLKKPKFSNPLAVKIRQAQLIKNDKEDSK